MASHKHAALIKAWADGAEIEYHRSRSGWEACKDPAWNPDTQYRIKPEPKPDIVSNALMSFRNNCKSPRVEICWEGALPAGYLHNQYMYDHIQFVCDGETGKLKSVSIIK